MAKPGNPLEIPKNAYKIRVGGQKIRHGRLTLNTGNTHFFLF